jgi:hypothetical protein
MLATGEWTSESGFLQVSNEVRPRNWAYLGHLAGFSYDKGNTVNDGQV